MIHSIGRYLEILEAGKFEGAVLHPVLVWSDPSEDFSENTAESTRPQEMDGHEAPTQVGSGLVFDLAGALVGGPGLTLGRSSTCQLQLLDDTVSRRHAEFLLTPAGWQVTDLGSHNGTRVEDATVPARKLVPLPDPARVRVGDVDLLFMLPASFKAFLRQRLMGGVR
jgi:pSer/pThr/pTyr-binding forkhead associated (FHA) protein